jgi:phenylalanyl-tRNA synthetase alpha chain
MQDTFYLEQGPLLRTHTSNVQIRAMTGRTPPFRFVALGRVYRHDLSPRHSPMFNQIEGFLVDERVSFGDLKGVLVAFGRHLFGDDVLLRFRANHFPFTEPSAELDVSCFVCGGTGIDCRLCKGSGWLEMAGCGMVDPNVFEAVGYDPTAVTGFAFGMGVERMAMVKHGISNIRHFIDNDIRVLRQFR